MDKLEPNENVLIGVKEASELMGIAHQTLESGLKNHLFTFGTAIPGKTPGSYRYVIFRECFDRCFHGEMQPCNTQQPI